MWPNDRALAKCKSLSSTLNLNNTKKEEVGEGGEGEGRKEERRRKKKNWSLWSLKSVCLQSEAHPFCYLAGS
jgi:hypothetical protein